MSSRASDENVHSFGSSEDNEMSQFNYYPQMPLYYGQPMSNPYMDPAPSSYPPPPAQFVYYYPVNSDNPVPGMLPAQPMPTNMVPTPPYYQPIVPASYATPQTYVVPPQAVYPPGHCICPACQPEMASSSSGRDSGNSTFDTENRANGQPDTATPVKLRGESGSGRRATLCPSNSYRGQGPTRRSSGERRRVTYDRRRLGYMHNILYKTEMCRDMLETNTCPRGRSCQFAHHANEMHNPKNHPLFKTAFCYDFKRGECPRGELCFHVHELEEMRALPGNSGGNRRSTCCVSPPPPPPPPHNSPRHRGRTSRRGSHVESPLVGATGASSTPLSREPFASLLKRLDAAAVETELTELHYMMDKRATN